MTEDLTGLRILAVHAHPDDEALWTGGLLAHAARRGATVRVVTCTLGEEGEVIGEPLQGLTVDHSNQLGGFRYTELAHSLAILGVNGPTHQPWMLGGAGRYRDSGMAGTPAAQNPRAFVNSGQSAVDDLIAILEDYTPHLIITYGPDGGYGHPDHIRAHQIVNSAVAAVGAGPAPTGPDFLATATQCRNQVLWSVIPETALKQGLSAITRIPDGWRAPTGMDYTFTTPGPRPDLDFVADSAVDFTLPLSEQDWTAKREAMAAHATQLWIADGRTSHTNPHTAWGSPGVFALSNLIAQPLLQQEFYALATAQGYASTVEGA